MLWSDILLSIFFLCLCSIMAGLTIGFVSLDITHIKILIRTVQNKNYQKNLLRLFHLLSYHHLVLVSLVLMNAVGNEALPIFLSRMVNEYIAIMIACSLVLVFGEIIPSALFAGPKSITIMNFFLPLLYITVFLAFPIAYPFSKILDWLLGDQRAHKSYRRSELKEFLRLQTEPNTSITDDALEIINDGSIKPQVSTPNESIHSPSITSTIINIPKNFRVWLTSFRNKPVSIPSSSLSTSNISLVSTASNTSSPIPIDSNIQKKYSTWLPFHSSSTSAVHEQIGITYTLDMLPISTDPLLSSVHPKSVHPARHDTKHKYPSTYAFPVNNLSHSYYNESKSTPLITSVTQHRLPSPIPPSNLSLTDSLTWNTDTESISNSTSSYTDEEEEIDWKSITTDSELIAGYVRSIPDNKQLYYSPETIPITIQQETSFRHIHQFIGENTTESPNNLHRHRSYHPSAVSASPELLSLNADRSNLSYQDIDEESLSQRELGILEGTLDLRMIPVSSKMIPIQRTFMLSTDDYLTKETIEKIMETGHSRIPIYRGTDIHNIKGILLVKLLLKLPWTQNNLETISINSISLIRPLIFHPRTSMLEALRRFQTGRSHMAIITKYVDYITNQLDICSNLQTNVNVSIHPFDRNISSTEMTIENTKTENSPNRLISVPSKRKHYPIVGIITLEDCLEQLLRVPIYDEIDFLTAHSRTKIYKQMHHKQPKATSKESIPKREKTNT